MIGNDRGRRIGRAAALPALVLVLAGCGLAGPSPLTGGAVTSGRQTGTPEAGQDGQGQVGQSDGPPAIGASVRDGEFTFRIDKVRTATTVGSELLNTKAQGKFILVHFTVKNTGNKAQSFVGYSQKLMDTRGREFAADSTAAAYLQNSNSLFEQINPGNSVKGVLIYDVPKDTKAAEVELHASPFSEGVTVALT
ncbi:DUF4352 domain-containing protein [Sphaerisporangium sp. B11E5]|uniref:DUF4352 domain-containing protein n=1 Tax=Sphaerisporangium sp. B11E5 TaxID=3153563 RepID=UPI00325E842F